MPKATQARPPKKQPSVAPAALPAQQQDEELFTPAAATLLVNKVAVPSDFEALVQRDYGKVVDGRLELALVEAVYLLAKHRITLTHDRKPVTSEQLLRHALAVDPRIHERYLVYRDLRDRGLVTKTGFKFGCDFRVYQRGVRVKRGPKAAGEHTKWIVYAVPEDYTCAFAELSRAVRLAHSIRARMLWAVVDNEEEVTYFEVTRIRP